MCIFRGKNYLLINERKYFLKIVGKVDIAFQNYKILGMRSKKHGCNVT